MFFLQFGLGGAGVQIVETRIFLRGTVMKASSHEKHSKQQWKKQKKWARSGERPGRGQTFCFFVFLFFHGFLQFRPMGKVWAIHTQTKKPKKQKKKPKNQKKKQKTKKPKKTKKTWH